MTVGTAVIDRLDHVAATTVGAWLGTANDWVVVVQFAALVPAALALRTRLRGDRLVRIASAAAVAGMGAIIVLQLLLLGNALDFDVQAPLVTICLTSIFVWAAVTSRRGYRAGELPRTVARFATLMGMSWAVGAAVAALALLLPSESLAQYAGFGLAALVGAVGWLAFPAWTLLLARHWPARQPPRPSARKRVPDDPTFL